MLILIEGLDFAGKETIAKILVHKLGENKIQAKYSTRTLVDNWFRRLIDIIYLSESMPNWIKTFFYGTVPFVDTCLFRKPKNCWIIHESYILRSIAYHRAYGNHWYSEFLVRFLPIFPKFDITIYLVATFEERYRRYEATSLYNERDRVRFANKVRFEQINHELELIMSQIPNCIRIDTTNQQIDETFAEIWHKLPAFCKEFERLNL